MCQFDCHILGDAGFAIPIPEGISFAQAATLRFRGVSICSPKVWIVKTNAKSCGLPSLAPHDLRRTCARLCHQAGGELDQIQFRLGHVSIQTTERYLGCKQRFHDAVNDHIGLEPDAPS